jgi:hypothetical protein
MARDDAAFAVYKNRRVKPERENAASYLSHLGIRVVVGIIGVRREFNELPMLDTLRHRIILQVHRRFLFMDVSVGIVKAPFLKTLDFHEVPRTR